MYTFTFIFITPFFSLYSKQSRDQVVFMESSMQTDLTMEDICNMEAISRETDSILKQKFVDKIIQPDSSVRRYLGVPSISMLFGKKYIYYQLNYKCVKLQSYSYNRLKKNVCLLSSWDYFFTPNTKIFIGIYNFLEICLHFEPNSLQFDYFVI
jgi:hypothetical protein